MKKAKSSYDLTPNPDSRFKNPMKYQSSTNLDDNAKHKVVIYFSDAYNNICNSKTDVDHAKRLATEMQSRAQSSDNLKEPPADDFMTQLKTVLEEKSKFTHKFDNFCPAPRPPLKNKFLGKPTIPAKPNVLQINQPASGQRQINEKSSASGKLLPSYIESIDENNVIKLKIEQNFKKASELVSLISSLPKGSARKTKRKSDISHETSSIHELHFSHEDSEDDDDDDDVISEPDEGYFYDWSFVQDWRSR